MNRTIVSALVLASSLAMASCSREPRADTVEELRARLTERPQSQWAFEFLVRAERFRTSCSGAGPYVTEEGFAVDVLRLDPEASRIFASLVATGSPPAQMYGLCGLWLVDRASFEEASPAFREDRRPVVLDSGCVVREMPVCELVWFSSTQHLDIARGGWARDFLGVSQLPLPPDAKPVPPAAESADAPGRR